MPIIAAFNSKGGSAKSTALITLGDALARRNATVSIIDTDPQRTIANWREKAVNSAIRVVEETNSANIHRLIREESARSTWVFIDMAGFTSDMRTPIISKADLVIIPMQPSPEDARLAAAAFAYIATDEETLGRPIERRVLWARTTPNFVTRVERKIRDEVEENDIPAFKTHLHERSAYKAMMVGTTLSELDPEEYNGIDKAIINADLLAAEMIEAVMEIQARKKEQAA